MGSTLTLAPLLPEQRKAHVFAAGERRRFYLGRRLDDPDAYSLSVCDPDHIQISREHLHIERFDNILHVKQHGMNPSKIRRKDGSEIQLQRSEHMIDASLEEGDELYLISSLGHAPPLLGDDYCGFRVACSPPIGSQETVVKDDDEADTVRGDEQQQQGSPLQQREYERVLEELEYSQPPPELEQAHKRQKSLESELERARAQVQLLTQEKAALEARVAEEMDTRRALAFQLQEQHAALVKDKEEALEQLQSAFSEVAPAPPSTLTQLVSDELPAANDSATSTAEAADRERLKEKLITAQKRIERELDSHFASHPDLPSAYRRTRPWAEKLQMLHDACGLPHLVLYNTLREWRNIAAHNTDRDAQLPGRDEVTMLVAEVIEAGKHLPPIPLRSRLAAPSAAAVQQEQQQQWRRVNLRVPFDEKDVAKARGARWDERTRVWYAIVPPNQGLDFGLRRWCGSFG